MSCCSLILGLKVTVGSQIDQKVSECSTRVNACVQMNHIARALEGDIGQSREELGGRKEGREGELGEKEEEGRER